MNHCAAVLALTTTQLWARLVRHDGATRRFERLLLRPPWNLGLFFGAYSVRPTCASLTKRSASMQAS